MKKLENNIILEEFVPGIKIQYFLKNKIYEGESDYQHILVGEIEGLGKSIFLNGILQSAQIDEYVYHEILVHPAFYLHKNPENVLILGGGEGATLREVLKHPVKKAVMVDIDPQVVEISKKFLPEWSCGSFSDKRTELVFEDARKFVEDCNEKFDIIISDLTDPFQDSLSINSFTKEFYSLCKKILRDGGILAVQGGSLDPHYMQYYLQVMRNLKESFKYVAPYGHFIFSFMSVWGFMIASDTDYSTNKPDEKKFENLKLRFFEPFLYDVMRAQIEHYIGKEFDNGKTSIQQT
uniref:Polyamine aminopropyltransferase n=1 Tax=candidate division WOR-3 bacterium TaxID=2052148 RepID=A0A7V4E421_UNCW3